MGTDRVRNVVVLGHVGTGKSTLVEAMLRAAGRVTGSLNGTTTVDHEPEERERGHSLSLAVASITHRDHVINLLDAPGGAEANGDAYPALLAADTAVFVVDAAVGLQPQHHDLWRACQRRGIPRVLFLNKCDQDRARHDERIAELVDTYGPAVVPVEIPLDLGHHIDGVIDVVHEVAFDEQDGHHDPVPIPEDRMDEVHHDHEALIETVVEHDDELLEHYLDGQEPTDEELERQLAVDIASGAVVPVLCGAAIRGIGVQDLLDFIVDECPAARCPDTVEAAPGATVAVAVKTFADPYVGKISVLRVLAGDLKVDTELVVQRTGTTERAHNLFRLCGSEQAPVDGVEEGDLVAVSRLTEVQTGDVLIAGEAEVALEPSPPPEGFHRVVFEPASVSDDVKLTTALERLMQEDPAIRMTTDPERGVRIVHLQGPTHVDVTVARLARRFGVQVEVTPAPIEYRETIRKPATAEGRHVKQSGGHGQYGVVTVEIAPRPRGEGFSFADETVGGVVPNQYVSAVEKGLLEAMQRGPLGGYPVVDVGTRLLDGKHHSVDSSDAAFRMAGILAFRNAAEQAEPVLLEPIAAVTVSVPEELTGAVLSDLSARRGRILGTTPLANSWAAVEAHVPEAELISYTADLRALTSSQAQFTMVYDHHDEVPDNVAKRILAPAG
jgi:elongation factor G